MTRVLLRDPLKADWMRWPHTKGRRGTPEAGRGRKGPHIPSWCPLHFTFWPPERQEFLLFEAIPFVVICYGSPRKWKQCARSCTRTHTLPGYTHKGWPPDGSQRAAKMKMDGPADTRIISSGDLVLPPIQALLSAQQRPTIQPPSPGRCPGMSCPEFWVSAHPHGCRGAADWSEVHHPDL